MSAPDVSVHDFKCPDCELNCQLIQRGFQASMRHQVPTCKTYEATKKDGQKFLELAYVTYPQRAEKEDPVFVAFRDGQKPANAPPDSVVPPVPATPPPPASGFPDWSPKQRQAMPPRWQPLFDTLSSELRALVHERGTHSHGLAKAIAEAKPGDTLVGYDDEKLAGVAQAIIALCAASKGHP